MKWQMCPICDGRGIVPQGFYAVPTGQQFMSTNLVPEQCRSCTGMGKILEAPDWVKGDNREC